MLIYKGDFSIAHLDFNRKDIMANKLSIKIKKLIQTCGAEFYFSKFKIRHPTVFINVCLFDTERQKDELSFPMKAKPLSKKSQVNN